MQLPSFDGYHCHESCNMDKKVCTLNSGKRKGNTLPTFIYIYIFNTNHFFTLLNFICSMIFYYFVYTLYYQYIMIWKCRFILIFNSKHHSALAVTFSNNLILECSWLVFLVPNLQKFQDLYCKTTHRMSKVMISRDEHFKIKLHILYFL